MSIRIKFFIAVLLITIGVLGYLLNRSHKEKTAFIENLEVITHNYAVIGNGLDNCIENLEELKADTLPPQDYTRAWTYEYVRDIGKSDKFTERFSLYVDVRTNDGNSNELFKLYERYLEKNSQVFDFFTYNDTVADVTIEEFDQIIVYLQEMQQMNNEASTYRIEW